MEFVVLRVNLYTSERVLQDELNEYGEKGYSIVRTVVLPNKDTLIIMERVKGS